MMRHTDRPIQLGKPRIAQATCGHFETFARARRFLSRVETPHVQGNVVQTAKFAHKRLISLALRAAQTEIDVQCRERHLQYPKRTGQCHRIGTAAQRTIERAVRGVLARSEKITNRPQQWGVVLSTKRHVLSQA